MPQRFLHSILFFLSSPSKDGHTPTVALLRYYDGRGPRRDGDAGAIKELRTEERGRQGRKKSTGLYFAHDQTEPKNSTAGKVTELGCQSQSRLRERDLQSLRFYVRPFSVYPDLYILCLPPCVGP